MALSDKIFEGYSVQVVAEGLRFPEGPVALSDGSVLVSELAGAIARVRPDGHIKRYDCGGGANGAAVGPDGSVYVANNGSGCLVKEDGFTRPGGSDSGSRPYAGGSLQKLNLETGKVETVCTHVDGVELGWLNEIVFDACGSCYFVDTTQGNLCYTDLTGGVVRTVATGLDLPNGLGFSPDGLRLYVSETIGDVLVWDIEGPGRLVNKRVHYHSAEEHGWDGLAVDGGGNVCVANLKASGISVISPGGEEISRFVTPQFDPWITNICFGGPDLGTAYICSAGRGILYSVRWPWRGLRLNFSGWDAGAAERRLTPNF